MRQCDKGHFFDENRYPACPYCKPASAPAPFPASSPVGVTVAVHATNPQPQDLGKTVGVFSHVASDEPAVGFLICVSGPNKGADFRLVAGRNFIGRSPEMDICLAGDSAVSREGQAVVSYDAKSNRFTLAPGISRSITYVNGSAVDAPVSLAPYDELEAGESKLVFLPFCGDRFRWE